MAELHAAKMAEVERLLASIPPFTAKRGGVKIK
jgi:hypothetical protein